MRVRASVGVKNTLSISKTRVYIISFSKHCRLRQRKVIIRDETKQAALSRNDNLNA